MKLFNLLGGRKFVFVLGILFIGLGMQIAGLFDSNFSTFLLGIAGIFAAGNALSKFGRN